MYYIISIVIAFIGLIISIMAENSPNIWLYNHQDTFFGICLVSAMSLIITIPLSFGVIE